MPAGLQRALAADLLRQPKRIRAIGWKAQQFVRDNFILTSELREHLTVTIGLLHGAGERIELG